MSCENTHGTGVGRKPRPVFTGPGSYVMALSPKLLIIGKHGGFHRPAKNAVETGGRRIVECLDCGMRFTRRDEAYDHVAKRGHYLSVKSHFVVGPINRHDDIANWPDHNGVILANHYPEHFEGDYDDPHVNFSMSDGYAVT